MKTIAKISEETLTIINYLQDMPHGQYLTYAQIQKDTKVKMDIKGKSYLRTACKKLKREYSPVRGFGIELASAKTAFYNEFTPQEQKQINFIGAAFGAIRVAAENGKHFLKNTTVMQPVNPMLPENTK